MSEPLLPAPAAPIRLVLARHGQTPPNVDHVLDTEPPGPGLTDLGRRQAAELADRLAEEKVVSVHASRALRAQQTAEPLARRHGLAVEVADGTHEIYVGELEKRGDSAALRTFDEVYAQWHAGRLDVPMPGGETGRQAVERFVGSARRILDDDLTSGAVVLVSHGAMLRLVAARLAANITAAEAEGVYLPNTGLIVLEPDPDATTGWRCSQWDGLEPS